MVVRCIFTLSGYRNLFRTFPHVFMAQMCCRPHRHFWFVTRLLCLFAEVSPTTAPHFPLLAKFETNFFFVESFAIFSPPSNFGAFPVVRSSYGWLTIAWKKKKKKKSIWFQDWKLRSYDFKRTLNSVGFLKVIKTGWIILKHRVCL